MAGKKILSTAFFPVGKVMVAEISQGQLASSCPQHFSLEVMMAGISQGKLAPTDFHLSIGLGPK